MAKETCNSGIFTKVYEWLFGKSVAEFEFMTSDGVWYEGKLHYTGYGRTWELRSVILQEITPMVNDSIVELTIIKV